MRTMTSTMTSTQMECLANGLLYHLETCRMERPRSGHVIAKDTHCVDSINIASRSQAEPRIDLQFFG